MIEKKCRTCGEVSTNFSPNKRSRDGYYHICIDCLKELKSSYMTGLKRTEQHCRNISKGKKGKSSQAIRDAVKLSALKRIGVPLSDEHKRKISEAGKGRVFSEETRKKMSEKASNRTWTEEQRKMLSKAHIGRKDENALINTLTREEYLLHRRAVKHGITLIQLKELYDKYDGKCWICKEKGADHIDHCHETLKVRGVLCNKCNTGLGKLGDSIAGLQKAIEYLRGADELHL